MLDLIHIYDCSIQGWARRNFISDIENFKALILYSVEVPARAQAVSTNEPEYVWKTESRSTVHLGNEGWHAWLSNRLCGMRKSVILGMKG